jgi:TonB family protein
MYFDFDDRFTDIEPVGRAINRRDGVVVSLVVHALILAAVLFGPPLPRWTPPTTEVVEARPREEAPTFVFVQPRIDQPAPKPPPRAEASDLDRLARSPERVPELLSPLPPARGNSRERVEAAPEARMRGNGPAPQPAPESPAVTPPTVPDAAQLALMQKPQQRPPAGGLLGDALRNLQRYMQSESFDNQKSSVQEFGPLQFDTKGVEFGPWIRRFVSQVRRNWFVPYAAMSMRGRVVITFNVHKNGAITDVTVVRPSEIESFNTAAVNALLASNPTVPLPPEYPDEKAFFTATFYYNEGPP